MTDNAIPTVTILIRQMRGKSYPALALADDGSMYVVKFANGPEGKDALFCESVGTELFRACGLLTPEWRVLRISSDLLKDNRDCWIGWADGLVPPAPGLCFGSRFLGTPGKRVYDLLPRRSYSRIVNREDFWLALLVDSLSTPLTRRKAIFFQTKAHEFRASFVNHGLLTGPLFAGSPCQFKGCLYNDDSIYSTDSFSYQASKRVLSLNADKLLSFAKTLPEDWKSVSTMSALETVLHCLCTRNTMDRTVKDLVDLIEAKHIGSARPVSKPEAQITDCSTIPLMSKRSAQASFSTAIATAI
jgi:hypothetical protein